MNPNLPLTPTMLRTINSNSQTRRERSLYNLILNGIPNQLLRRRTHRTARSLAEKEFDLSYYKLEYYSQRLRDELMSVMTADYNREKQRLQQ